jgi:cellobiose phosphorylase
MNAREPRRRPSLHRTAAGPLLGKAGGLFSLEAAKVLKDDAVLLAAAARVVLGGSRGTPADQRLRESEPISLPPPLAVTAPPATAISGAPAPAPPEQLLFWNGLSVFTPDAREYLILIDGGTAASPVLPPVPWANVLANPGIGCLVTEAGLGCSWADNSQFNCLTPWNNDTVSDPPAEAVYLRDEESGEVWSPTPLPAGHGSVLCVRHGQGYTSYSQHTSGLEQELLVLVPKPGYTKGYVPGIRENGGQYTHASTLGVAGDGAAKARRQGAGAVEPDQPGLSRHHAGGGVALQGRAKRRE